MNLQLCRPPVGDLVFQLYGRPVHPELFDVLAVSRVERGDFRASLWVTRTGHALSWDDGKVFLTEVAASAEDPLPERAHFRYRLRGEHCGRFAAPGVLYQTSFQVEVLPPELFHHVHAEIVADGAKRGLLHIFAPHHRWALSPLGYMTAESRPGSLVVHAFHTFPDEHTVVKSQTLIEARR
jgi:hypothetical protein